MSSSADSVTIEATTIGGPLPGGPYLLDGTIVEPIPALHAYLRALTDVGIPYERLPEGDYPNLLVFKFVTGAGPDAITRFVVQYPETDDAYAIGNDPYVIYGLATFSESCWPDLTCTVYGGGVLAGIWPSIVREESRQGDVSSHTVHLLTGYVDSAPIAAEGRRPRRRGRRGRP